MITMEWKKCPNCKKRFGFKQYSGMRSWTSWFGAETGSCPHCNSVHITGKFANWERVSSAVRFQIICHMVFEVLGMGLIAGVISFLVCMAASAFIGLPMESVFILAPIMWLYLMYNIYRDTTEDFEAIRGEGFRKRDAITGDSVRSVTTPRRGEVSKTRKLKVEEKVKRVSDRGHKDSINTATGDARESNSILEAKVSLVERDEQDTSDSVSWKRVTAEQGDSEAQYALGCIYSSGKKVPKDDLEAVVWFTKAAEQGHAAAQSNLGTKYYDGRGVPQSYIEAVKWFRKSAEQNHASGQINLGGMYYKGEGLSKDNAEAVRWYRRAAEQGEDIAQGYLASSYFEGKGVPQDYPKAYMWSNIAASKDNEYALRIRDSLLDVMSREQVTEGQSMSRKWLEHFEKSGRLRLQSGRTKKISTPVSTPLQSFVDAEQKISDEIGKKTSGQKLETRNTIDKKTVMERRAHLFTAKHLLERADTHFRNGEPKLALEVAKRARSEAFNGALSNTDDVVRKINVLLAALCHTLESPDEFQRIWDETSPPTNQ